MMSSKNAALIIAPSFNKYNAALKKMIFAHATINLLEQVALKCHYDMSFLHVRRREAGVLIPTFHKRISIRTNEQTLGSHVK